jgi:hypothetical protein
VEEGRIKNKKWGAIFRHQAVVGTSRTLEGVDDIECGSGFPDIGKVCVNVGLEGSVDEGHMPFRVLSIRKSVTKNLCVSQSPRILMRSDGRLYIFQELFENTASLFVHGFRDTLHTATTGDATNRLEL